MASSSASSVPEYLEELPAEKRIILEEIRNVLLRNLPPGFQETMQYGMICYVVPHHLYPPGYHTDPSKPLPFLALAAQKNNFSLYHMGLYSDPALLEWFQKRYASTGLTKLDMGKSCIRFKKKEHIPFALIGELAGKISPEKWISLYEKTKPAQIPKPFFLISVRMIRASFVRRLNHLDISAVEAGYPSLVLGYFRKSRFSRHHPWNQASQ